MSSFTGTAIFGVSTGGNPLPISVGAGANRMVIALAGHNRSDGHFEQMFINGVPGRIAADRLLVINKVQVAYWLDADLPTAGSYDITIDGAGSNRIFSALYVEGARQELIDSDGQDERTDNQNIFTLDCDGDTALLVMVQAAPDSGAESSATELYNQGRFAAWYQIGQGQTIQASMVGGQSSALNIAVAAAFEPLGGGDRVVAEVVGLSAVASLRKLARLGPAESVSLRADAVIRQRPSGQFAVAEFVALDGAAVLAKRAALPVSESVQLQAAAALSRDPSPQFVVSESVRVAVTATLAKRAALSTGEVVALRSVAALEKTAALAVAEVVRLVVSTRMGGGEFGIRTVFPPSSIVTEVRF